jgi:hypothetical protein
MIWYRSALRAASGTQPPGTDMAFRPLHDPVVVRRIDGEDKIKAGSLSLTPPKRSRPKA